MIEIKVDLTRPLAAVMADPVQVEQILLNLAVNARDAMPEGGTLTFSTARVDPSASFRRAHSLRPGGYVLLRVADTGFGMDAETLSQIFDPFFTTKPPGTGTGLGLSTVYGIVRGGGGHVECRSTPGMGAEFRVYLPEAEPMADVEDGAEEEKSEPSRGERILIVEDERAIRTFASEVLSRHGYEVVAVESGEEALEIFEREGRPFDLVVMDVIMPGMGGRRALAEIRRRAPKIKTIVASGYSNGEQPGFGGLESTAVLPKPFGRQELLDRVRAALDAGPAEHGSEP
jgi:CheY-like chemotaxis protein